MEQPLLFSDLRPIRYPVHDRSESIQDRFEAFHHANPHVYRNLVGIARKWRASGRDHIGISMLFEVMRYHHDLNTSGDDFKLNNNYRSRYVRLIKAREPDLAAMFETRELKAA